MQRLIVLISGINLIVLCIRTCFTKPAFCRMQPDLSAACLEPEGGSKKATLLVVVVVLLLFVVISSLKIPKAFLIRSGAQQNFAYTFMLTFPTDLPFHIFHLFSN